MALTKTDMVEPDWLDMVTEDVRAFLAGTFLADAPVFPVSSATGEGLEALRAALTALAGSLAPRPRSDIFRLPRRPRLQHEGTRHGGHGARSFPAAVLWAKPCASCRRTCPPARAACSATASPRQDVAAGQRCAVNVQGLEVADIERWLCAGRPGELFPSSRWMVRLTCLASAPRALRQRVEIHFHHGTRECPARVVFRDRDKLAPGETALAELRFKEPLAGVFGDHCVLRAGSPLAHRGGAVRW